MVLSVRVSLVILTILYILYYLFDISTCRFRHSDRKKEEVESKLFFGPERIDATSKNRPKCRRKSCQIYSDIMQVVGIRSDDVRALVDCWSHSFNDSRTWLDHQYNLRLYNSSTSCTNGPSDEFKHRLDCCLFFRWVVCLSPHIIQWFDE